MKHKRLIKENFLLLFIGVFSWVIKLIKITVTYFLRREWNAALWRMMCRRFYWTNQILLCELKKMDPELFYFCKKNSINWRKKKGNWFHPQQPCYCFLHFRKMKKFFCSLCDNREMNEILIIDRKRNLQALIKLRRMWCLSNFVTVYDDLF